MARIERPTDDRTSNDLRCWELPGTPVDEPASCPLLHSVNLLPLRYGRVEAAPEGTDSGLPYSLTSRPLGYRLPRNGYIYVLDADAGELHEYHHENGELTGHNGGKLEYPKRHTLYVSFSEVAWTERKKAQVMDDPEERDALLQKIDLASASPLSGGKHLLTPDQAKAWVAEFAEEGIPEAPEGANAQESEPYHWENQPYYHQSRFGKLIKQQDIEDPSNCLCLVLQDDVGVMLDLAQHQDDVVSWIGEWAESGDTERDYMLGVWIESMTQVDEKAVEDTIARSGHPAIESMREDLEKMPEDKRSGTQAALVTALNQLDTESRPGPNDASLPAEVKKEVDTIRGEANRQNAYGILARMQKVVDRWYVRETMAGTEPAFVDSHMEGILALEKQHREQLRDILEGSGFGQRGINDLIDRPKMDAFMAAQRENLARWQALLTDITHDRVTLLCDARYHQATWYFDPQDEIQIEPALDLQYACLKDTCRSDEAAEQVLEWMEKHPQYTRPLFHTLPMAEQSGSGELADTYAKAAAAGYGMVQKAADWIDRIKAAEAGKLPDITTLSRELQDKASAVGDTLAPAVSLGIARSLEKFNEGIGSQTLPTLDELFRDLPYFFKRQMLDAIDAGTAEFRIASEAELTTFRENLSRMLALNERMTELTKDHDRAKKNHGHRSDKAKALVSEFKATREEHRVLGDRLAAALSPVEEVDTGLKLDPAVTGRAGLTLILPALDQQELGRLMGHFREGISSAPRVNLIGDGLGVLIAAVQLATLGTIFADLYSSDNKSKFLENNIKRLGESFLATAGSGLLAAQGVMDTAYSARSKYLANAWQRTALKAVHIQMGKLHVGLGILAYGAGAISAAISTNKHWNNWREAVRTGNHGAQTGAVMGMVGSSGLTATNALGFGRTLGMGWAALRAADDTSKALAWATAGRTLSTLFARINIAGLVFTVFELGGTWLYNRHNLSERDQWLLSTPWSRQPERIHNGSLADYEAALAGLGSSVTLEPGSEDNQLVLNCHGLPAGSLAETQGDEAPYRVWLSAWRVHPARPGMYRRSPEVWEHCTYPILTSQEIVEGVNHLQLAFTRPPHEKSKQGVLSRELFLLVKVETRQPEGHYTASVYMLKEGPDSRYPLVPVQESPEGEVIWRRIPDSPMDLDIYL